MRGRRFIVYILRCSDGTYYTGMTSDLAARVAAHQMGLERKAYTFSRRPITYLWSQEFTSHDEAFHAERRIKGWSRAKKEALIWGDLGRVHQIVRAEWEAENSAKPARRQPRGEGGR